MKPGHILTSLLLVFSPLAFAVDALTYRVVERIAMPPGLFVQGLEFNREALYVSTGKYGQSRLLRFDFPSMTLNAGKQLPPQLFAEGLTVLDDDIFQLTWRSGIGLVFDRDTLDLSRQFALPGQGWGLCHDGERLIYSDGSDRLYFMQPDQLTVQESLAVTRNDEPVDRINELECHEGHVWANRWQSDEILEIDAATGAVIATLDLSDLFPLALRPEGVDVLNGIAINPEDGGFWVTGKYWPWLYRLEINDRDFRGSDTDSAADSR